jgi:DNA-binding NtrC family response regulator
MTPVIVLSSYFKSPTQDDPPVSVEDGAFACLSKPVDARLLLYAVDNALAYADSARSGAPQRHKGWSWHWKPGPPLA